MTTHDKTDDSRAPTNIKDPLQSLDLPSPLILGSASFTRKLILKEMGIPFQIVVRPIDERNLGNRDTDPPKDLVHRLAHAKMDHLVQEIEAGNCRDDLPNASPTDDDNIYEFVALTADQVVTCNGKILEKPDDISQAKEFVTQYGSYPCSTVGCVALHHWPSNLRVSNHHIATIYFNGTTLSPNAASRLVDELVSQDAPVLSCAGGLMIEHPLTQQYVDRVEGTEDSVMGLDKATVSGLLAELRRKLDEMKA